MHNPTFFALIIGTEILNRRRDDKHFDFLTAQLLKRGQKLSGSFIIEDDPVLIIQTIRFIASQPGSVLFSFGGIGSTPDDHTRKCASVALRDGTLHSHKEAHRIIADRIEKLNIPNGRYPLQMAELPKGAKLLENPVNGMPAFYLDDRYFFMPGFPQMSHPMVEGILEKYFNDARPVHRMTLTALCRETELIEVMEQMPRGIEFSSLPKHYSDGYRTTISVAGQERDLVEKAFVQFQRFCDEQQIPYTLNDEA
jgi:molybdopterin-biosynthesis enzyme MoeA-like protein